MASHVVATVEEIPPGKRKLVEVNGRPNVVFNLGGDFYALNNRCPHRGGSLADGIQPIGGVKGPANTAIPARRDGEVPVARLGVRHPHRQVVVRPEPRPYPAISGGGEAGTERWKGRTRGILPGAHREQLVVVEA